LKLVDTNVFIYARGRPHDYKEACARLSAELVRGDHDANIDTELLQEVLFFFWRRRLMSDGFAMFDQLRTGFPSPFAVTLQEAGIARDVLSNHPTIAPRDAIHAAVVLAHGLEGIISTDRGFDSIPGVTRFDPLNL
jgi:predicted nucleic acid-binding protein